MQEKKSNKQAEGILQNKTITIMPIVREGGWLPKGHDGEFMYTGTVFSVDLPLDPQRGGFVRILTQDEQAFFEQILDDDLSFHKKDKFWSKFRVNIRKDDELMRNGFKLNLADPVDNLRWRVLKVHPTVAPSWKERFDDGAYRFALIEEDYKFDDRISKATQKEEAFKFFSSIRHSEKKLFDFLRAYYGFKQSSKVVPPDMKKEAMQVEALDIMDADITGFLEVASDPNMEMRVFLEDAIACGAIIKEGRSTYKLPEGDKLGSTTQSTVDYLTTLKNKTDDVYLTIKARVDNAGV